MIVYLHGFNSSPQSHKAQVLGRYLEEQGLGAEYACPALPPLAEQLIAAFWPGPLTVVVPRRPGVATAAAGGQDTIALRCPAHPLFHEVLAESRRLGVRGLAAPSANRFGRVSPTTAAHVSQEFEGAVPVQPQRGAQEPAHGQFVFDDEHKRTRGHETSSLG